MCSAAGPKRMDGVWSRPYMTSNQHLWNRSKSIIPREVMRWSVGIACIRKETGLAHPFVWRQADGATFVMVTHLRSQLHFKSSSKVLFAFEVVESWLWPFVGIVHTGAASSASAATKRRTRRTGRLV